MFRRLREEADKSQDIVGSYTSSTVVTKTIETYDDINNHEQIVMETTEVVTEEEGPIEVRVFSLNKNFFNNSIHLCVLVYVIHVQTC